MAKWNEENMRRYLYSNPRAVEAGIVLIYNNQTEDEKTASHTRHHNGLGFSKDDDSYGSYLARWVLDGKHLTGKHFAAALAMCIKYRRQIILAANEKEVRKTQAMVEELLNSSF